MQAAAKKERTVKPPFHEACERLQELQAAAIEALRELDAPKVQISDSYERLVAAIDACDVLLDGYEGRVPRDGH